MIWLHNAPLEPQRIFPDWFGLHFRLVLSRLCGCCSVVVSVHLHIVWDREPTACMLEEKNDRVVTHRNHSRIRHGASGAVAATPPHTHVQV